MKSRTLKVLILLAVLCATAWQVLAQENVAQAPTSEPGAIKLEYKFTPNELLRYKVQMDMDMVMQMDAPNAGAMPPMQIKMVMVLRQRTKKVLPNGDAEINAAVESMKMEMMGQVQEMPTNKMPVMRYTMTKTGEIKQVAGMEQIMQSFGGMPGGGMSCMPQFGNIFPTTPVKPGDVWEQDVPFPFGNSKFHIKSNLVRTGVEVGKYRTNEVLQSTTGKLDLGAIMGAAMGGGGQTPQMGGSADLVVDTTTNFSETSGQVVRSQGNGKMNMSMDMSGMPTQGGQAPPGKINIAMNMKFDMFLLPPQKGK